MFDQELQESIQAFKAIGAEIELQPILAFLAATRARTVLDGSAVQRQQPTGTLPEPIEPSPKITSNMSKRPFVKGDQQPVVGPALNAGRVVGWDAHQHKKDTGRKFVH